MKKRVKVYLFIISLSLISLFFICLHHFFYNFFVPFENKPFKKGEWWKVLPDQRAKMAEDLINKHIKTKMSVDEIKTLLGEPNSIWLRQSDVGYRVKGAKTYAYYIGSHTLNKGFDDTFIYIHFDASEKVILAEISGF